MDNETATQETEEQAEQAANAAQDGGPPDELKVVIQMKGWKAIIVVGTPDCDPRIELCDVQGEGDPLLGALALVPEVVRAAREQWAAAKRYPAHKAPTPPPAPAGVAKTASARRKPTGTAKAPPKPPEQVGHTLHLL